MEDPQPLLGNVAVADDGDDQFYEEIEAPKFVDFTTPDRYRPDDQYWFCMRVGCDRKHEEELDPDKISKDFVLRVMAARSPNVRLRKALDRKCPSSIENCPLTAPAKPTRRRLSRFPVVSSLSQKLRDVDVKASPPKCRSISKAKPDQSVVSAKPLKTPRHKKCLPSPNPSCSVRNHETNSIEVSKKSVAAKAIAFKSPKKVMGTKVSQELKTPLSKLCKGMKRLEISSQETRGFQSRGKRTTRDIKRDYNKPWSSNAGRGPKSSQKHLPHGSSQNCIKAMSSVRSKRKSKEMGLQTCCTSASSKGARNYSSDMEIDEKSRDASLELQALPNCSRDLHIHAHLPRTLQAKDLKPANCQEASPVIELAPVVESSVAVLSDVSGAHINSQSMCEEKNLERGDDASKSQASHAEGNERVGGASEHKENDGEAVQLRPHLEINDKENASVSKNNSDLNADSDDNKENASVSETNSELNLYSGRLKGKSFSKPQTCEAIPTVTGAVRKTGKESAQAVKYKRPKPTNPKPFRLRTDERGILKEANLEKKLKGVVTQKDDSTVSRLMNQEMQESEHQLQKTGTITSERRLKKTFMKGANLVTSPQGCGKESREELVSPNSRSAAAARKRTARLPVIKEASSTILRCNKPGKPREHSTKQTTEDSTFRTGTQAAEPSRSSGKKMPTIPKEPNFHTIHKPKGCTRMIT